MIIIGTTSNMKGVSKLLKTSDVTPVAYKTGKNSTFYARTSDVNLKTEYELEVCELLDETTSRKELKELILDLNAVLKQLESIKIHFLNLNIENPELESLTKYCDQRLQDANAYISIIKDLLGL